MSENGQLTSAELQWSVVGGELAHHAARGADRLALAFADHFGRSLIATDCYRTLAEQIVLARLKPALAAEPGTSNHGWGLAMDLASRVDNASSAEHAWMDTNARRFGWVNPAWAHDPDRFEPWHWEYVEDLDTGTLWLHRPTESQVGLGSDSDYVASLQHFLNSLELGMPDIIVDGSYGMATYAAVRRFQRRNGLKGTGVVGVQTRVMLARRGFGEK